VTRFSFIELFLFALSALATWLELDLAPALLASVLATSAGPWYLAWSSARGTALRPALVWAALALGLLGVAQVVAMTEPLAAGRPITGRLTYLAVLALLAAVTSVLNARTPGERVWAGLMAVLVVVFLIPWLEEPWRLRRGPGLPQLHLDAPWTIFYALLVVVGVTNYLPTRYGPAAASLGLVFFLEYLGLTRAAWPAQWRAGVWEWVAWSSAAAVWVARWCSSRARADHGFACVWLWFRDHWGVVWALRIRERFNREAELAGWPFRLTWFGLEPLDSLADGGPLAIPSAAEPTLRGLLRRFAHPWRLDQAAQSAINDPDGSTSQTA
jgi:hypothetical protein